MMKYNFFRKNLKSSTGLQSPSRVMYKGSTRSSERGNIFFALFGAVAIVGVLGAAILQTMRGPLSTMVEVNRQEQVRAELRVNARLALGLVDDASLAPQDPDGFTEPAVPITSTTACTIDTAGGLPGGGCLPVAAGLTTTDPWGSPYGYCAWNLGQDTVSIPGLLQGTEDSNFIAIVVASAGPDRTFNTTCQDAVLNDPTSGLTTAGDDYVEIQTLNEAVSSGSFFLTLNEDEVLVSTSAISIDSTDTSNFAGDIVSSGEILATTIGGTTAITETTSTTVNTDLLSSVDGTSAIEVMSV